MEEERYGLFLYHCINAASPTHTCGVTNKMEAETLRYELAMRGAEPHPYSKKLAWLLRALNIEDDPDFTTVPPSYLDMEARRAEGEAKALEMIVAIEHARATADEANHNEFIIYAMETIVMMTKKPLEYSFDEMINVYRSALSKMRREVATLTGHGLPSVTTDVITTMYTARIVLEFYVSSMRRRGTDMECIPYLLTDREWESIREPVPTGTQPPIAEAYDRVEIELRTAAAARVMLPEFTSPSCGCSPNGGVIFLPAKSALRLIVKGTLSTWQDKKVICTTPVHDDEAPHPDSFPELARV